MKKILCTLLFCFSLLFSNKLLLGANFQTSLDGLNKTHHFLTEPIDTVEIEKYLLGEYKVVKLNNGYIGLSGNIIKSTQEPKNMLVIIAANAIKFKSIKTVTYNNFNDREESIEPDGRILNYLCDDGSVDLKMIAIREFQGSSRLVIIVFNLYDQTYTDYELWPVKE